MNGKNREEKLLQLLEMQAHPERFTDDELQAMLDDEDIREDIKTMRNVRNAFLQEKQTARHGRLTQRKDRRSTRFSLLKMAAMFIGCVLLVGIAFAAVRLVTDRKPTPTHVVQAPKPLERKAEKPITTEPSDTIARQDGSITFDNEELQTVLTTMAEYYKVKVNFENEASKHIKLFLVWDKQMTVAEMVEMLNQYDRINIAYAANTLTIK